MKDRLIKFLFTELVAIDARKAIAHPIITQ
jgi:hypothetical protein